MFYFDPTWVDVAVQWIRAIIVDDGAPIRVLLGL
jgi:hypothetical protein